MRFATHTPCLLCRRQESGLMKRKVKHTIALKAKCEWSMNIYDIWNIEMYVYGYRDFHYGYMPISTYILCIIEIVIPGPYIETEPAALWYPYKHRNLEVALPVPSGRRIFPLSCSCQPAVQTPSVKYLKYNMLPCQILPVGIDQSVLRWHY